MHHISSALTAIRRSPYQALSAVLILTITFFVAYSFSLFIYSSEKILRYFETRPQVTAFFSLDTKPDAIQNLEKEMRNKDYVDGVTVISKEKALEIYREDNKKDPLLLELVTAEILPASIEVSAKDANSLAIIKDDLSKVPGVDEVVYQQDVIESLQKWTRSLRYIGITSVAILAATSFMIIVIISGMKVAIKKKAINIMRILGATKWYIKAPFVYEGILYGVFSSLIGWGLMYVGLLYLTPWLTDFIGTVPLLPFPPAVFLVQLGAGTLSGILLGAFASSFAVQRMMRKN
jgi:cell division transport system permease protein